MRATAVCATANCATAVCAKAVCATAVCAKAVCATAVCATAVWCLKINVYSINQQMSSWSLQQHSTTRPIKNFGILNKMKKTMSKHKKVLKHNKPKKMASPIMLTTSKHSPFIPHTKLVASVGRERASKTNFMPQQGLQLCEKQRQQHQSLEQCRQNTQPGGFLPL
jgi:hypothetical protein